VGDYVSWLFNYYTIFIEDGFLRINKIGFLIKKKFQLLELSANKY